MEESGTVTYEVESDLDRVIVENRTSTSDPEPAYGDSLLSIGEVFYFNHVRCVEWEFLITRYSDNLTTPRNFNPGEGAPIRKNYPDSLSPHPPFWESKNLLGNRIGQGGWHPFIMPGDNDLVDAAVPTVP